MKNRYAIELSYKGTEFHGWQMQPGQYTVQSEMQRALSLLCKQEVHCIGCGRTDTGVHAKQFLLHFDLEGEAPLHLMHKLNHFLTRDIGVFNLYQVAPRFSARFDCIERSYEYYIHQKPDPFVSAFSWYFTKSLDIEKMNKAAERLLTHKNFQCFCRSHSQVNNFICDVREAYWTQNADKLTFKISANRFLRNMVRAIVGTLVDVGLEKVSLDEFEEIILSQDRRESSQSAPANGLFLTRVIYPPGILGNPI